MGGYKHTFSVAVRKPKFYLLRQSPAASLLAAVPSYIPAPSPQLPESTKCCGLLLSYVVDRSSRRQKKQGAAEIFDNTLP